MNKKILFSHFSNMSIQNWRDWRWQFKNRVTSITHWQGFSANRCQDGEIAFCDFPFILWRSLLIICHSFSKMMKTTRWLSMHSGFERSFHVTRLPGGSAERRLPHAGAQTDPSLSRSLLWPSLLKLALPIAGTVIASVSGQARKHPP